MESFEVWCNCRNRRKRMHYDVGTLTHYCATCRTTLEDELLFRSKRLMDEELFNIGFAEESPSQALLSKLQTRTVHIMLYEPAQSSVTADDPS